MEGDLAMLTDNQILENKAKWLELCSKLNFDMTELVKYLDAVNYWEAPFSATENYAYKGGLVEYTLKFVNELGILCNAYKPGVYSAEDILKVGLFKEIYRGELYEPYERNVKNNDTGMWEKVQAYKIRDQRATYGSTGFSSYMTIQHFYKDFTDEQIEAIVQTNTKQDVSDDPYEILKSYPLIPLVKMAMTVVLYLDIEK